MVKSKTATAAAKSVKTATRTAPSKRRSSSTTISGAVTKRSRGQVRAPASSSSPSRFEFETLKPNFPLFRGSALSDSRVPADVGFFYFSGSRARVYAHTHLRGNWPVVREFRPVKPLKLFVMNRPNLDLLVAAHPSLRETVRAVTGLGMERGEAYRRHHLPISERHPIKCIAEMCTAYSGIRAAAGTGLARKALGVAGAYVPGGAGAGHAAAAVLAAGAVAYHTLGLGRPRRGRAGPDALEIHDSGFLSQADAVARIIASKRLALDMRAALRGVDGWVYTEPQARARSLADPRFGKFQREVMLWEPEAKVRAV